jgi:hypothetical protein
VDLPAPPLGLAKTMVGIWGPPVLEKIGEKNRLLKS